MEFFEKYQENHNNCAHVLLYRKVYTEEGKELKPKIPSLRTFSFMFTLYAYLLYYEIKMKNDKERSYIFCTRKYADLDKIKNIENDSYNPILHDRIINRMSYPIWNRSEMSEFINQIISPFDNCDFFTENVPKSLKQILQRVDSSKIRNFNLIPKLYQLAHSFNHSKNLKHLHKFNIPSGRKSSKISNKINLEILLECHEEFLKPESESKTKIMEMVEKRHGIGKTVLRHYIRDFMYLFPREINDENEFFRSSVDEIQLFYTRYLHWKGL